MGLLDEFRKLTHPYSEPEDDYDDYLQRESEIHVQRYAS